MEKGLDPMSGTLQVRSETVNWRRTYVATRVRVRSPMPRGGRIGPDINRDYQRALDYQASVDRKNVKVSRALRELTDQVIDDPDPVRAREDWRVWWGEEQGYPYSPGAPRRRRTVERVASTVIFWSGRHSCFAAGTPVRTLLGMRPIESVQVGDQVLAQDVTTGALSFEPVVALHHNPPKPTLRIDLGDEAIVATPIHRFWKAGQGWAMARDLKPGDTIRRLGGTARVVSVSEEKVQPVFNLDVAQSRSFFVGSLGRPGARQQPCRSGPPSVRCPEGAGGRRRPLRGREPVAISAHQPRPCSSRTPLGPDRKSPWATWPQGFARTELPPASRRW